MVYYRGGIAFAVIFHAQRLCGRGADGVYGKYRPAAEL
ncbi:MAG: hypothetical protein JWO75_2919 [Actinomycetia bacterium]|jgi:hypothetical protein|nr:hypothetical protein [Actinomycetes bacterium]